MRVTALLASAVLLLGCATAPQEVRIADRGPNAVAQWSELAAAVVILPALPVGTPEERRPVFALDMATLHLAIHRAVLAAPGESRAAAVHAAGHAVLRGLFPQRDALYQPAYAAALASLPDGAAKDAGLRIGAEQAARVLALRADDGRWKPVPDRPAGAAAGLFQGNQPLLAFLPGVRPFTLAQAGQFRGAAPPALDSETWATDLAETRQRGGRDSPATAEEERAARFHTMPPPLYWTRNLQRFARSQPDLAGNARLMALLWVTQADATIACFEAKYHHLRWRPQTAISTSDPAWQPRLPTPNHPEYPAAHGCTTAALAENLAEFFGTRRVVFGFESTVTQSAHTWPDVDTAVKEVREARIVGGMHFRFATLAGERLGVEVARHVGQQLR